ncbi:MAG: hydroxymethylglutaryl-CoA reductase, degradative [Myxococcota bacterium]|nr:hydroxymethylglutaryl-CoA reductase, degradative [Myxococcota bacterium]
MSDELKPTSGPRLDSRIPGFYRLNRSQRADALHARFGLSKAEVSALVTGDGLDFDRADKMVENCIGVFGLPIGLGLNFRINGQDYAIPMVVEEPSVVAAVSHMAKVVRPYGGFEADADPGIMIAQVQVTGIVDFEVATQKLMAAEAQLLALANSKNPNMVARGGGAKRIEIRTFDAPHPMLVVHLLVDCVDAMGANAVNTMAEAIAPEVEACTGGRVYLRILSNLADQRCARARCAVPFEGLEGKGFSGESVAEGIVHAYRFAAVDPYRAATHNKGVMNGIDAVAIATGNDWRGIEAGAHAFAARNGHYTSLTTWRISDGQLHGEIELPMAVGTVGGSTEVHPTIKVLRGILGVESARELAMVMAAVGLAQNMGALKALATEGIQRGHMSLHARQAALAAGASSHQVDAVAEKLIESGNIKQAAALRIIAELNGET